MKHTLNQKAMRSSPHPDTPSLASLHKARELGSGEDLWAPIGHPPSRAISPMLWGISVVSSHPIPVVGASYGFRPRGWRRAGRDPRLKASSAGRTPHCTGNTCSLQAHMEQSEKHAWASLEGVTVQCSGRPEHRTTKMQRNVKVTTTRSSKLSATWRVSNDVPTGTIRRMQLK